VSVNLNILHATSADHSTGEETAAFSDPRHRDAVMESLLSSANVARGSDDNIRLTLAVRRAQPDYCHTVLVPLVTT
jgi:hypothetical protein